jgi:hypothetical protein
MAVPTNPNLASVNYANINGSFIPYNVIGTGSGITASTSLVNNIQTLTISLAANVVIPGTLSVTGALTANDGLTVSQINLAGTDAIFNGTLKFQRNLGGDLPFNAGSDGAGGLAWNFSNGLGEVDFFNGFYTAHQSFAWYQSTSTTSATNLMTLSTTGALDAIGGYGTAATSSFVGAVPAATQINILTLTQGSQPAWIFFQPASSTDFNLFNGSAGTVASFHQAGGMTIAGTVSSASHISSAAPSVDWMFDCAGSSGTNQVSLAVSASVVLPVGSGIVYIYAIGTGVNAMAYAFLVFGSVVLTNVVAGLFSTTAGNSGTINIFFNGSSYQITNNTPEAFTLAISTIRLRSVS